MSNHMIFWRAAGLKDRAHERDTSHRFGVTGRPCSTAEPSREERAAFWRCLHRTRPTLIRPPERFARPH